MNCTRKVVALCALVFVVFVSIALEPTSAQVITNHSVLPPLPLGQFRVGATAIDPVFHFPIVRLTDAKASNKQGTFPNYSKRQAWNADETLLLLQSDDGEGALLYDG
jgi:hypothetical protein